MEPVKGNTDQPLGASRETLFLVTFQNQINLIQIADNKANIIISINAIIISIIVSVTGLGALSQSFEVSKRYILFPVTFIIITSLISVVFAIQAAKPKVTRPTVKVSNDAEDRNSLLFFANISNKNLEEYLIQMDKMLESNTSIRENMIIDIFNQGKILSRKYALLNIAYQIFMYGFIVSVLTFLVMLLI
jgi:hypothetical protein